MWNQQQEIQKRQVHRGKRNQWCIFHRDVEKRQLTIKQQFCRRVSAIALGHCFTISKNYANATKPPHLILTQFIKIITYRRHAKFFFPVLLGADESSSEYCGHNTWEEYRTEWEWGVRETDLLQKACLVEARWVWGEPQQYFCVWKGYQEGQVSNVSHVPWRWAKTKSA